MTESPPHSGSSVTKPTGRIIATLLILLAAVGLVDWWSELRKESRYDAEILRVAGKNGVDPALVKAVVWRESKFNPKVRGRVGEIGLMQIRPLTAQEWTQSEFPGRKFEGNLFEPQTNLQIGAWYLGKLLRRYAKTDNPLPYALADYNAGRNNVLRWNKGAAATNSALFLTQMTFPATQEYIRSISKRSLKYQRQFATLRSTETPKGK